MWITSKVDFHETCFHFVDNIYSENVLVLLQRVMLIIVGILQIKLNFRMQINIRLIENFLLKSEAATRSVILKKVFLEISWYWQESTCARVSLLIKLQS